MITRKAFLEMLVSSAGGSALLARLPLIAQAGPGRLSGKGSNRLLAGTAKKVITPSRENLAGYKSANAHFSGEVGEDIYARIIVLGNDSGEKLLLVSTDLVAVPGYEALVSSISAKYGIEKTACIMTGTGNHQAIAFDRQRPLPARMEMELLAAILAGVGEAIASMQPARMAYAKTTSNINVHFGLKTPTGIVDTLDFSGFADKDLSILRIDDLSGKTLALYVNYGVQSNMLEGCSGKVSGDLAGNISAYIERRLGCICAWSIGAAAEVYPLAIASVRSPIYGADGKLTIEEKTLSEEVVNNLRHYLASTQGLDISDANAKIDRFVETFTVRCGEQKLTAAGKKGPLNHRLHLAVVNEDIAFAGANSITSARLGKIVKDMLPYRTFFLSSEGDVVGYVVDRETHPNGIAGSNTPATDAWESERIYIQGFSKLATITPVKG